MADIIFGSGISIGTGISVTPPPFTIPNAPTIGSATATGSTTATVAFTQPGSDGGSAILSYTATSSPGGITGTLSQAGSGTINMTGLSQGTSYTFTVTATNAIGTSSPSSASNSITTYTVPGAPTIGTATAIGSTTATVTFTAPASDGGSTITSYTATSSPDSITGTLSQAGSGTITVNGLTPSTSYTFTVTATNSIGTGSASSASNSTTTTAPQDSYFEYNTLLIPGASTTFVDDASTNNFAVTINGDTKPNNFNPYTPGYYSNYFDGSSSYLTTASSLASAGDFTLEAWIYRTAATTAVIIGYGSETTGRTFMYVTSGGSLATSIYNIGDTTFGGAISLNQWTHIAMVRSTNVITGYINGTAQATTVSNATTIGNTGGFGVGAGKDGSNKFTGYISNARVVNGVAVYTGNFTPSTTPLTAIANTNLLTSQSNRFIDNSTNAYTITTTGSPTINSFDPFVPNTSYSTYGGGYFDGTGDYLTAPANAAFNFTGNATVEAWIYINSLATPFQIFGFNNSTADSKWLGCFVLTNGTLAGGYSAGQAGGYASAAGVAKVNQWIHIAWVKNGSNVYVYANGVQVATATSADSYAYNNGAPFIIGRLDGNNSYCLNGYMNDLRVVNGTAVYTSAFTPPSAPLTAIANTQLLTLQNNQSVNNNVFLDNSTNNSLITRAGNATQGTFSPYGANWSNYFDGTGDYLTVPSSSTFQITGDFTIEAWVYATSVDGHENIMSQYQNSTNSFACGYNSTLGWYFNYANNAAEVTNYRTGTPPLNTWTHVAFVKSSTTMTIYVNGTALASTITVPNLPLLSSTLSIGIWAGSLGDAWNGYISNLRMVKGTAVYTGNFTPSTTPLTAITDTSLLTCQSNRFIDNSTNAFAITVNGNTNIQRFSPFSPSAEYSTSTIGGSAYFDGSSSNIITTNTVTTIGTQDFCLEAWVYCFSTTDYACIIGNDTAAPSQGWFIEMGTTRGIFIAGPEVSLGSAQYNRWVHIVYSRVSGTYAGWVNGVRQATGSLTINYSTAVKIGINSYVVGTLNKGTTGYISDGRVTVGSSPYSPSSTTITVPTAPLTAVQNTVFLSNMTSGGAYDAAMMNNMETVGNAKLSTAVSKFGGSSISFDGTGDYLVPSAPNSNLNLVLGTGNFTIEFWVYFNSGLGSDIVLYDSRPLTTNGVYPTLYVNSSSQLSYVVSGTDQITSGSAFSATTWYHVALCRSSTSTKMFINGTQVGSTYTDSNNYLNPARRPVIAINGYNETAAPLNGYIDDLRVTLGYARYTSNFTAPTQAFPTY